MCRLAAAHKTIRLMLLGLPPDMVHGVLLHRAHTSIFRNLSLKQSSHNALYIIISQNYRFVKSYLRFFLNNNYCFYVDSKLIICYNCIN